MHQYTSDPDERLLHGTGMTLAPTERNLVISTLGVVQILAWGSTYYLPAILTDPILRDTGWSRTSVVAAISVALFASALVATRVGRAIQLRGGRPVLATGMGLIALGLAIAGLAPNLGIFLLAWCIIGVGMGAGLYDAAFSTLGRIYGSDVRRAITSLTLWGGFASTVCWPISAWLVEGIGWRGTYWTYSAIHLAVSLPLCLLLPKEQGAIRISARETGSASGHFADARFWGLAMAGTLLSFVAAVWSMLLVSLLGLRGVDHTSAVALGMLIGPAQVAGRVADLTLAGNRHPVWTMLAATSLVAIGFAGLLFGVPVALAFLAYGAGNGLWSIARGAMPLALFRRDEYPRVIGRLATPSLLAAALAPTIGAVLLDHLGPNGTLLVLTALALPPVGFAMYLRHLARRHWSQSS